MAAYRTANRLFTGSHLPPLCIGMEHARTNNLHLAEQLVAQAKDLCEDDPMVYNEMGAILYRGKRFEEALQWFEWGLERCPLGREGNNAIQIY
jgi:anaphase-promoting complex subunit 6